MQKYSLGAGQSAVGALNPTRKKEEPLLRDSQGELESPQVMSPIGTPTL